MQLSLPEIPEQRRSSKWSDSNKSKTFLHQNSILSGRTDKQPSKTVIMSKNLLFHTVLREETEEIVEDDFFSHDFTPLDSEVTRQKPRTLPELGRSNKVTKLSEAAEENKMRGNRVKEFLDYLHGLTVNTESKLETLCQFRDRRSNTDLRDRILRTSENIINLYNIRLNIVDSSTQDSLMGIDQVKDRFLLARLLQILVQELARFPYSFFKKIGLSMFTVCQKIELFKDKRNPIVRRKLLSGMFALDQLYTENDIVNAFYQVVFFHFKEQALDLDTHWAKVYFRKSKAVMNILTSVVVTQSTKSKNYFEEQYALFRDLVRTPNVALKNESNIVRVKAFKIKDSMEKVDPDGVTEAWWKHQGWSLVVGSLDHF